MTSRARRALEGSHARRALDGVIGGTELHAIRMGEGPPLVLLHGFTGSAATWSQFLPSLAARYTVLTVDLPGHGRSPAPADPTRYALERVAEDLASLLDQLGWARVAVLGYSLGGRTALRFALEHPARAAALVLESTSAGMAGAAARAARVARDGELADSIEREGVAAFVRRWEALPLWRSQERLAPPARAELQRIRLAHSATGLANSLRGASAGLDEPVRDRLGALACPALAIVGALDEQYLAAAREIVAAAPAATLAVIPNAGHAVHLEAPGPFLTAVERFLAALPVAGSYWC